MTRSLSLLHRRCFRDSSRRRGGPNRRRALRTSRAAAAVGYGKKKVARHRDVVWAKRKRCRALLLLPALLLLQALLLLPALLLLHALLLLRSRALLLRRRHQPRQTLAFPRGEKGSWKARTSGPRGRLPARNERRHPRRLGEKPTASRGQAHSCRRSKNFAREQNARSRRCGERPPRFRPCRVAPAASLWTSRRPLGPDRNRSRRRFFHRKMRKSKSRKRRLRQCLRYQRITRRTLIRREGLLARRLALNGAPFKKPPRPTFRRTRWG